MGPARCPATHNPLRTTDWHRQWATCQMPAVEQRLRDVDQHQVRDHHVTRAAKNSGGGGVKPNRWPIGVNGMAARPERRPGWWPPAARWAGSERRECAGYG